MMATCSTVFCGICDAQHITKNANSWCPECEEGFCSECLKHHNVSKYTRSHEVISIENYQKLPPAVSNIVYHCPAHKKGYQHYCTKHESLCCPLCISTNHRECVGFLVIEELIKSSKTSTVINNMEHSLKDIAVNLQDIIKDQENNFVNITKQRQTYQDEIKLIRKRINDHLDKLENTIIEDLNAAETKIKSETENLLSQMKEKHKTIEGLQNNLTAMKTYASHVQTFLSSKTMKAEVDREEKYMQSLLEDDTLKVMSLKLRIDDKIEHILSTVTSFGSVSTAEVNELRCVDETALNQYTKLQENLKKAEEDSKTLFNNPQLKKMKFDIQKAVNTPINSISPVSGEHLRDKLQRLQALLSKQTIEVSGRQFSLSECPQALPFCKYLIAKMIVKKGEEMVSAKHSSAFAVASVTVGLIADHPDLLHLLLGHFHRLCPYTVPYHIPKFEGQSLKDYYKALGYKYDLDGNAEKQDQFLKRMSGIMRLYASIMVSHPPRGPNTYGIEYAWNWLSMVMNIEPLSDITAAMTFDLLEVTGHALFRDYRKQFVNLLHVLIKEFLPKLKKVASPSGGGPMTRLEDLLQNSVKHNGIICLPEGLNANFCMSWENRPQFRIKSEGTLRSVNPW